jgi:putative endonuclease
MKQLNLQNKIGKLGEDIVVKYLHTHGFTIIFRNYLTKYGEIDIIAEKCLVIHFIEVKAKSVPDSESRNVNAYKPEYNMHYRKLHRMHKTIEIYMSETNQIPDTWQIDLFSVTINRTHKTAEITPIWNIIQ